MATFAAEPLSFSDLDAALFTKHGCHDHPYNLDKGISCRSDLILWCAAVATETGAHLHGRAAVLAESFSGTYRVLDDWLAGILLPGS